MEGLLISVDGLSRAEAEAAVAQAVRRWRQQPVAVYLLSVQPPVSGHVAVFLGQAEILRAQDEAGLEELAPVQALLDASGVPHIPSVKVGHRAETIARTARELGCGTIVMGGDNGDAEATIFGSLAQQVRHIVGSAGNCQVIGA